MGLWEKDVHCCWTDTTWQEVNYSLTRLCHFDTEGSLRHLKKDSCRNFFIISTNLIKLRYARY